MSNALRFGLPGGRGSLDPRDPMPTVEFARTADELGFDCLWFGEEHFVAADGDRPRTRRSPLILAAAIAASTSRIRIGFSGLLPTLHNPVRLAEDIGTLDVLSSGRVNLGVGWPKDRYGDVFAGDHGESRLSLQDTLDAVLGYWAGRPLLVDGAEQRVVPTPLQLLHPLIYVVPNADEAIVWAAERGYAVIQSALQSPGSLRHSLKFFADHGGQVSDAPVERLCFVAESNAVARQQAWPLVIQLTERERGEKDQITSESDLDAERFYHETALIGDPDTVAQRILQMRDEQGIGFINVRPSFTGLTPLLLQRTTVALFSAEVMPRLAQSAVRGIKGAAALLALYENGPCSLCRSHAVELLYGLAAVPPWMFEQCLFDAVFDLRAKVETWLGAPLGTPTLLDA